MRNLLLTLCFCGTRYHGFQVQKNALSICQVVQDALETVLGQRGEVKGCSRTDTGVHARMYCLSVRTASPIACDKLVLALNRYLPEDVAVTECRPVPEEFHARYSCVGKEYVYIVHNSRARDPFSPNLAYRYGYSLDAELLNRQAQHYLGTHDFAAFASRGGDVEDTVRHISSFTVLRQGDRVLFTVCGSGFLYNMVRIMVGTLIYIQMGKIEPGSIPDILLAKNRDRAGKTMPAHGLYLNRVFYEGLGEEFAP